MVSLLFVSDVLRRKGMILLKSEISFRNFDRFQTSNGNTL